MARARPARTSRTRTRPSPPRRPARRRAVPLPPRVRVVAMVVCALAALAAMNWVYQAIRKPTELWGLVAPASPRTPRETWAAYGPLFDAHSTSTLPPEFLAALVQVESAGDPFARTYWRWRWSANPFELYSPASSAVGLLQITDGTFDEARTYCVHDHEVARAGDAWDPSACWFNGLYFRNVASHSIEMTSARLTALSVAASSGRGSAQDRQRVAAVIHLCGKERGEAFAARGFRARPGERCGDHDLAAYLARLERYRGLFATLARAE